VDRLSALVDRLPAGPILRPRWSAPRRGVSTGPTRPSRLIVTTATPFDGTLEANLGVGLGTAEVPFDRSLVSGGAGSGTDRRRSGGSRASCAGSQSWSGGAFLCDVCKSAITNAPHLSTAPLINYPMSKAFQRPRWNTISSSSRKVASWDLYLNL
jgi:hypothetical protein